MSWRAGGHLIAVSLISFASVASAQSSTEAWLLGGKEVSMARDESLHLLISARCRTGPKTYRCKAFEALARASLPDTQEAREGGRNPGSLACASVGGKIVIAVGKTGHELSFCEFTDGSLVDSGSLAFHASLNGRSR